MVGRPEQRQSDRALLGRVPASAFELVASFVQNTSSSPVLDPSNGSVTGIFPLIDNGFVTQESNGNLLYSANGYVETVSPTGKVLARFGAPHIEGNGVHTGSGEQFYYPAQAAQGSDGTIYTADPLYTMEATSPARACSRARRPSEAHLDFGGWNFALVGGTFYFQSGPPFNIGADSISSFSPRQRSRLPRRHPGARPTSWAGVPGSPRRPPATISPPGRRRRSTPPSTPGGPRPPPTSSCPTRSRATPP